LVRWKCSSRRRAPAVGLPIWIDHYDHVHPHRALDYRSPREFIDRSTREARQPFRRRQQWLCA
jgi:putative transposase